MRARLATALFVTFTVLVSALPAGAEAAPFFPDGAGAIVTSMKQNDTNGDSRPDVTIIDGSIMTAHDRVTVYDGANDMRTSHNWWEATDFINDTWVFDTGADGTAQLIIQFRQENQNSVAVLWDDASGDGQVDYDLQRGTPRITESRFPTLTVTANGGWFLADGSLNPNFSWKMDGCGGCAMIPDPVRAQLLPSFARDGRIDFQGGEVKNGDTNYVYRVMLTNISSAYGIPRDLVQVKQSAQPTKPPQGFIFWPFLGGPNLVSGARLFDRAPFVPVNWQTGKLGLGLQLSGYPIEAGYSINSLSTWTPNAINNASFENPMAYYDLAGDADDNPELHIRVEYYPPGDPSASIGQSDAAEDVRYSWNQSNATGLSWDYKLGLAGLNDVTSTEQYGPYQVRVPNYNDLPQWVVNNRWEWETFVASEGAPSTSSEGIYEWSAIDGIVIDEHAAPDDPGRDVPGARSAQRAYLTGKSGKSPISLYTKIRAGFRGEVATVPQSHPELYFSPVDARLHLAGATTGIYQVDATHHVEYRSLEDTGFIDDWRLFDGDHQTAELIQLPEWLLYITDNHVSLVKARVPRELFRTAPPTDHTSWVKLGDQLSKNKKNIAADNLQAMFEQFTGERINMTNVSLSDFRVTTTGYRFILDVRSGYDLGGLNISGIIGTGSYTITYNAASGAYAATKTTAADPQITSVDISGQPTAQRPETISLRIENTGTIDLNEVPTVITATKSPGKRPVAIREKAVDLLADEPANVSATWQPPTPGRWAITTTLYLPNGEQVSRTRTIDVGQSHEPPWQEVVRGAWPHTSAPLYLTLLFGLVTIPLASGILLIRHRE
jgi:hypothetical protein